jgi:hypothetical protein
MATYRLILVSTPGPPLPVLRLRALLKASLRVYGLRCVEVEEISADTPKADIRDARGLKINPT